MMILIVLINLKQMQQVLCCHFPVPNTDAAEIEVVEHNMRAVEIDTFELVDVSYMVRRTVHNPCKLRFVDARRSRQDDRLVLGLFLHKRYQVRLHIW